MREDAATGSPPEAREAPFYVLQEKIAGFWSYGQIRSEEVGELHCERVLS